MKIIQVIRAGGLEDPHEYLKYVNRKVRLERTSRSGLA